MKPDRDNLLSIVTVEIVHATADIDRAVLQRRWRDYCHQLEECLIRAKEEDLAEIAEKHFRLETSSLYFEGHNYSKTNYVAIRRQGVFASYHQWEKPTEDQRIADVVLAVRNGDVPYNKLLAALGVKICVGPEGTGACELPLGHEGPHRLECLLETLL